MCGICGWISTSGEDRPEKTLIDMMVRSIRHRGPDHSETWIGRGIGLGHSRLAVIDTSPQGNQPMFNEDRSLILISNGEIYNYPGLREKLERNGHRFYSSSDSEVILHLWEEKEEASLEELRGMFAFAIWNTKTRTLFLARDRFGKKPLFYASFPDRFLFASEPKAFLCDPRFSPEPDLPALHQYLAYQSVSAPFSAFKGVRKLPHAHVLELRGGKIAIRRFWKLSYGNQFPRSQDSPAHVEGRLHDNLKEAVNIRLRADVPLGTFLSGGLDSSLITAIAARATSHPLKTFSAGFREQEYDERPFARIASQHIGTEHHEIEIGPNIADLLPELVWHYGEPFADSSAIPTYLICKAAREQLTTVVLSGDGGDENFGGYPRYLNIGEHAQSTSFTQFFKKWAKRFSECPGFIGDKRGRFFDMHRLWRTTQDKLAYYYRITHIHEGYQKDLFAQEFRSSFGNGFSVDLMLDRFDGLDGPTFVDKAMAVDLNLYLPDTLMTKTDIASMAHGLEVRSPFLDHHLTEFCAQIPAEWKINEGKTTKWILKRLAKEYLPDEIIDRPKMGFGVPLDKWFRNEIKQLAGDYLLSPRAAARGYFQPGAVASLFDRHQKGESWQYLLWNLLMFELWHLMFIDRTLTPPAEHFWGSNH